MKYMHMHMHMHTHKHMHMHMHMHMHTRMHMLQGGVRGSRDLRMQMHTYMHMHMHMHMRAPRTSTRTRFARRAVLTRRLPSPLAGGWHTRARCALMRAGTVPATRAHLRRPNLYMSADREL